MKTSLISAYVTDPVSCREFNPDVMRPASQTPSRGMPTAHPRKEQGSVLIYDTSSQSIDLNDD